MKSTKELATALSLAWKKFQRCRSSLSQLRVEINVADIDVHILRVHNYLQVYPSPLPLPPFSNQPGPEDTR